MHTFEMSPNAEIYAATHEVALIEDELRSGFLGDIASVKFEGATLGDLTPAQTANVISPERDFKQPLPPRARMIEEDLSGESVKEKIASNGERIISRAEALQLRRLVNGERQSEDTHQIDREKAVFIVEGGAQKSSVIRRGVAEKAMHEVYGQNLSDKTLYQFSSSRKITPTKATKKNGVEEVGPNPEHKTLCDLAGSFLSKDKEFTEFEAALATARADGYQIRNTEVDENGKTIIQKLELVHEDLSRPKLVLIQPAGKGNLSAGYEALRPELAGKQLVIASNGQYRLKNRYRATQWINENNMDMLPPVTLGDEPGDTFSCGGKPLTTDPRAESVYVNEFIIAWRLGQKILPDVPPVSTEAEVTVSSDEVAKSNVAAEQLARVMGSMLGLVGAALRHVGFGLPAATESHPAAKKDESLTTSAQTFARELGRLIFILSRLEGNDPDSPKDDSSSN